MVDSFLLCLLASMNHSHLRWQIYKAIQLLFFPRHAVFLRTLLVLLLTAHTGRAHAYIWTSLYLVWVPLLAALGVLCAWNAQAGQSFLQSSPSQNKCRVWSLFFWSKVAAMSMSHSRSTWAGVVLLLTVLLLAHSWEVAQMETARTSATFSFVSTLTNTFDWNELYHSMWEKVTVGLIAGTVYINNKLHHQHNFTLTFSILCFLSPSEGCWSLYWRFL